MATKAFDMFLILHSCFHGFIKNWFYIYTRDEYTTRSSSNFSINKNDKTIMYHIITIVPQQDQPHIKRKLKI